MRDLVSTGLSSREMQELLSELAKCTLCWRHSEDAAEVSEGWDRIVRRHVESEEQRMRDASASSRGEDSDDDDDRVNDSDSSDSDSDNDDSHGDIPATNARGSNNDSIDLNEQLQQRMEEIARLQQEFERLRDRLMNNNDSSGRSSTAPLNQSQPTTTSSESPLSSAEATRQAEETRRQERRERARRAAEAAEARRQAELQREAEARRVAEEARREEALRQSRREAAEERARLRHEKEERERREAEAEWTRLREEQERLDQERQEQQRRSTEEEFWESAWTKYEAAWSSVSYASMQLDDADIRTMGIWPTRSGLYSSCCEDSVKEFFAHRPHKVDRKGLRRQFMRWHPDRAERLFSHVREKESNMHMMTMVSQVVAGVMASC